MPRHLKSQSNGHSGHSRMSSHHPNGTHGGNSGHGNGHAHGHTGSGIGSILPRDRLSLQERVQAVWDDLWRLLLDQGGLTLLIGVFAILFMASMMWGLQQLPTMHPVFARFLPVSPVPLGTGLRPFWNGLGLGLISGVFFTALWVEMWTHQENQQGGRRLFQPAYGTFVAVLSIATLGLLYLFHKATHLPLVSYPLGIFTLMVTIFMTPRVGMLATTLLVLVCGLVLNMDGQALGVLWFGSLVGVFGLNRHGSFRDRAQLMKAGLWVALAQGILLTALDLVNMRDPSGLGVQHVGWTHIANPFLHTPFGAMTGGLLASVVSALLTGPLTLGILPFLEWLFQLVTPYRLMELANHNQPLLKRMQFEAPGTFHHSIMVASLSEAAAEAIGANPLLARVGSLYHDIGKMKRSLFFIENQAYFGVDNPHDKLTPRLSKMVITAHPRDSLEMAEQYGLPHVLRKFMTEHHGTLLAGHFYNQACQQEGAENVEKDQFRYPGPKPNIKETAIVMLADACESACRALKQPTPDQIDARIDKLVAQRIEDGQFDECPITLQEISMIKQTFAHVLRGIQHQRLEYQMNNLPRPLMPPSISQ